MFINVWIVYLLLGSLFFCGLKVAYGLEGFHARFVKGFNKECQENFSDETVQVMAAVVLISLWPWALFDEIRKALTRLFSRMK